VGSYEEIRQALTATVVGGPAPTDIDINDSCGAKLTAKLQRLLKPLFS